jgi:anthranilate phosphoribosyltransferase
MVEAYILITVGTGEEHNVFDALSKMKEVTDVSILYGEWDLIIKVKTEVIENLDPLVTGKIRNLHGVKTTMTMIVAKSK